MKLILTISGLCLLACKSDDGNPYPEAPSKVDVIIPDAPRHAPRVTFSPRDFRFGKHYMPDIVPDDRGGRMAAIDFTNGGLLKLAVNNSTPFSMNWGMDKEVPQYPLEVQWMRWVPTLKELGFGDVMVPPEGPVPGASVRLTLPGGHIMSRNIVKENRDGDVYVKWIFPAVSRVKAVANEIVCEMDNVVHVNLTDEYGDEVLKADIDSSREVRLSISNDLAKVPKDYMVEVHELQHAVHFDVLAPVIDPPFKPPYKAPEQRTARPICNQAIYVYTGNERVFSERKKHTCHS